MIRQVFLYVSMFLTFYSCDKKLPEIEIYSIELSKHYLSVVEGDLDTLKITFEPETAHHLNFNWESSDTAIVKVNSLGIIKGVGPGIANVTVASKDGKLIDECVVSVVKWTVYKHEYLDYIKCIAVDKDGVKWIGTDDYGLFRLEEEKLIQFFNPSWGIGKNHVNITDIAIDREGNKWISANCHSDNGVAKFDGTNWSTYTSEDIELNGAYVKCIAVDNLNNVWVGSTNGISKFDGSNWTTYNTKNCGLVADYIYTIEIDFHNNIWISTLGGEVLKIEGSDWITYNSSVINIPVGIRSICQDSQGVMWCASPLEGVCKFDGANWTMYDSGFFNEVSIWSITNDLYDNKWFMGSKSIIKFDGINLISYPLNNLTSVDVHCHALAIDSLGNKWIGTHGFGIIKLQDY